MYLSSFIGVPLIETSQHFFWSRSFTMYCKLPPTVVFHFRAFVTILMTRCSKNSHFRSSHFKKFTFQAFQASLFCSLNWHICSLIPNKFTIRCVYLSMTQNCKLLRAMVSVHVIAACLLVLVSLAEGGTVVSHRV